MARRSARAFERMCGVAMIAGALSSVAWGQSLDRPPQDEVFYQIMPIAWRDSDNDVRSGQAARFGDFNGLTASLDYLQNLGVTAVYLQPVFPSPAYHGYQHNAADTLNPWFGTQADFQNFVNAAHGRGIKVILDYVAYGISQSSVYYTSARNNPSSPYDAFLAFTNGANTSYVGSTYTTWNGSSVGFINWNLNNAGAVGLVTTWARKWLDPNGDGDTSDGVDGYRLDHAYSNSPEGWGATISFWQTWCQSLRTTKPGVFLFCEPGDWGNYGADVMTPTGFDAVLTKPFEFAARDAVNNAKAQTLYDSVLNTVISTPAGKTVVAQINDHDSDRLASALGGSVPKHKAAAAVLMTQPFPPNIYFGDELGMRGTTGNFGSDANDIPHREPFKWNAVAGAPMSNYFVLNTSAYNARVEQNNDGRSVQEQQGVSGSLLETYRALIAARKASVALRRGTYLPVGNTSSRVWSFVRQETGVGGQSVVVAINLSGSALTTAVNLSAFGVVGGSTTPVDLVSGLSLPAITTANRGAYTLTIPAYGSVIASAGLVAPVAAGPVPSDIDGKNIPTDFGTGALVATQTAPTSLGDNVGELDQMFVRAMGDGLRIGVTGNIPTDGTALAVWLDTGAGGQGVLNTSGVPAPPSGAAALAGTTFDADFAPDHMFFINCYGGGVYVDQVMLLGDGALKFYRGAGTANSNSGTLTGGSNLTGLAVAVNRTNTGGVTGTSVASAATATSGFEIRVPYGDIGLPDRPASRACARIGVCVALVRADGTVSNQLLPGLPATSTTNLGAAPNLSLVAGAQWAQVRLPSIGDFNGDGAVSVQDIFDGLNAWFAGDLAADFNVSGALETQDVFDFLNAWFAGCP